MKKRGMWQKKRIRTPLFHAFDTGYPLFRSICAKIARLTRSFARKVRKFERNFYPIDILAPF